VEAADVVTKLVVAITELVGDFPVATNKTDAYRLPVPQSWARKMQLQRAMAIKMHSNRLQLEEVGMEHDLEVVIQADDAD
jgi:hypothetical protein